MNNNVKAESPKPKRLRKRLSKYFQRSVICGGGGGGTNQNQPEEEYLGTLWLSKKPQ